jgi:hypothetical protein
MQSSTKRNSGQNRDGATKADLLVLQLEVHDPKVIEYLLAFDESKRVAQANEALRVGVYVTQPVPQTLDPAGLP